MWPLYTLPKVHIGDWKVDALLDENYQDGILECGSGAGREGGRLQGTAGALQSQGQIAAGFSRDRGKGRKSCIFPAGGDTPGSGVRNLLCFIP